MKKTRRLITIVLCLVLMAMLCISASAVTVDTNLNIDANATSVSIGDSIQVTLSVGNMTVSSFTGGVVFDPEFLECVSTEGTRSGRPERIYLQDSFEDWNLATAVSTVSEANASGRIGFAWAGTQDTAYPAQSFIVITFRALAEGETRLYLYEDSAGTDGKKYDAAAGSGENSVQVNICPVVYTVRYDANGGSGAPEAQTKTSGEKLFLSTAVPVRSGYTFLGWSEDEAAETVEYQPGDSYTDDADIVFYAVWHENEKLLITGQPVGFSGEVGDIFTFSIAAQGKEVRYQWQTYGENEWINVDYPGNQTDTLTGQIADNDDGRRFRCRVTDAYSAEAYSEEAVLSIAAPGPVASGSCGDELTWTLDKSGVLTITGSGAMKDYNTQAPWYEWRLQIRKVILPEGLTTIGQYAFYDCRFTSVTIPSNVTVVKESAFRHCTKLESVEIPEGVTSLRERAFSGCVSLQSFDLPESVKYLGTWAFEHCSGLTSVSIPGVTSVGGSVFSDCTGLKSVVIPAGLKTIGGGMFYGCSSLASVLIARGVTEIEMNAFHGCSSLQSIVIPNTVTRIYQGAFSDCSGLTSVTIGENVAVIEKNAFYGCSSLTNLMIPNSVTSIWGSAFSYCSGLIEILVGTGNTAYKSVDGVLYSKEGDTIVCCPGGRTGIFAIPEGVTSIADSAFSGCRELTGVTIPESVTVIGAGTFSGCKSLTSVTLPEGITSIDKLVFSGCSGLTEVTIPAGVTSIGINAFDSCSSLTSVTIPGSVSSIGNSAFYLCNNLTDVYYGGMSVQWEQISIGNSNSELLNATRHYGLIITGITANKSGVNVGETITWTAEASGGNGALQYCFVIFKDGVQVKTSTYASACIFSYTPTEAGSYTARVYVKDTAGTEADKLSGTVTVTVSTVPVLASATATPGWIAVKWKAVSGATKYAVYRKTAADTSWTRLTNTCTTASYTDKTGELIAGTTYYYTVRSYVNSEWGDYDKTGVSAKAIASTAPALTSATATPGWITVKWKAVSGATKYSVYRKAAGETSWTRLTTTVTTTSYTDKTGELIAGTTYYYTVRSYVNNEWGDHDMTGVSAKAVASTAPILESAVAGPGQITVKWKAVGGASKYAVYRKAAGETGWTKLTSTVANTTYTDKSTELAVGTTYYYTVRSYVNDGWGDHDMTGISAKLTEPGMTKPVITTQPAAKTVIEGSTATFKVVASGTGLSYQWQYSKDNGGTWTNKSGATAASYTVTAKASYNGIQYRCKVTNTGGSVYSNAAKLTVSISKPVITTQPAAKTVIEGATTTFKVVASGTGLSYQWQYSKDNGGTWTNRSGATAASYTVTAKTSYNGIQYRCKVTNAGGSVYSASAKLTVVVSVNAPTITSVVANKTSAETGEKITWTATASGGEGALQYYFIIYKDGTKVKTRTYSTTATFSYTPTEPGTYKARVYVKDANETKTNKLSSGVTVTVGPLTVISVKADKTSTTVGNLITWTVSAAGGEGTLQYRFYVYKDGTAVQHGSYGTGKTFYYAPMEAGTYKVKVYVKDASGTKVNKLSAAVTVS